MEPNKMILLGAISNGAKQNIFSKGAQQNF